MGEFGVVGEEEKENETHTTAPSLPPGVKVKQVMIMKGKDDSENRTEREERGDFRVFWQPSSAPIDRRATCE